MSAGSALKGFFGLIWRILDGIRRVLHLVLMLVIFGFVLAALHTSIPAVPRTAALVIAPQGELVEQLSGDSVRRALGEASGGPSPETLLRDVTDAIAAAKSDSRIKLIVLDLDQLDASGLSKLQEIGAALRDFHASGKRVIAMGDSYSQVQYYLAAQAGEVYLDPMGEVSVHGFSYYRMYYKDAIDKLDVDSNVFKAGTFKSYTDQFSRSDMAPSEREETSVWLEALWNAYSQDVTRARSLPSNALQEFIAAQPASLQAVNGDLAKMALQRGLVTALKSRRQVADDLKGLVGEDDSNHSFNGIGVDQYLAAVRSKRALKGNSDAKVGIVVASGEIFDGRRLPGSIGGESTSDLLRQARYDHAIKAVVLRVDSPGGSEFASEKILREVQALRKAGKPVVVSMSSYAASGGYYISAAANQIFASPTTITGSIGVFSYIPTFERSLEKLGVKVDGLGTTPLAGDLRLDRALGPVTKQLLQASVDHAYQQFLRRVADGRKKSVEDVDKIAQGRVWAGADAQRIGLVDHLGGLKDATDAAAKLAELGSDYDVDYIETELSLRQELLMQIRSQAVRLAQSAGFIPQQTGLERLIDPFLEQARVLARLKDPRGLYSYCWCSEPSER
ncbi:MAG TPA: signal peptide peptidase SppA [Steroidobacteraceae bacterium]|jgi:protease-4|nr:signal peptide peptidase SppA [Steroidobacteraceae bacterium]